MKNYGIDWERELREQSEGDYIFGSTSPICIASIKPEERIRYLPFGEIQRCKEDTMDCASRAPVNKSEVKFNYLLANNLFTEEEKSFLIDNDYITEGGVEFSDAYIAIKSGTTRQGNSLKSPLQAIHEFGLVPKSKLPLIITMTFEEYHNPARITPEIEALGLAFKKLFTIYYDKVTENNFDTVLDIDMLITAGYAWEEPNKKGVYPRSDNDPNHAFLTWLKKYFVFDNYKDSFDGDFIKNLAPDYNFLDYGYRLYITRTPKDEMQPDSEQEQLIGDIIDVIIGLLQKIKKMLGF